MKKKKALFVYVGKASFVARDIEIFSGFFSLEEYNFRPGKKWMTPFQILSLLVFLLLRIKKYKAIIIQLAGWHSVVPVFLSRLFNTPSFIIAAGTDCHSFPSIGYGNYQRIFLAKATRYSFRNCHHILPKHESLWQCNYSYSLDDFEKQGIKQFIPDIKTPYTVIENGFDDKRFSLNSEPPPGSFLTIGGSMNYSFQEKLKGIDLVLQVARHFPKNTFTIIGLSPNQTSYSIPENVKLLPAVPNDELPGIYSRHRFYLQLSMAEGFPNALCEAMLCQCIPIGSDVFSIPDIIGSTGYILKERNVDSLVALLTNAIADNDDTLGVRARERIFTRYSIEIRKEKFRLLFEKTLR